MTAAVAPTFDPEDPDTRRNPWPAFARLREQVPVFKLAGREQWVISRYRDVAAALRDPDTFSSDWAPSHAPLVRPLILHRDPPGHTEVRRHIGPRFTSRVIEAHRAEWVALADGLAADVASSHPAEFIETFANRLPMTIIGRLLGVSFDRVDELRAWTLMVARFGPGGARIPPHLRGTEFEREAKVANERLYELCVDLIAERRAHPRDDLTTELIQVVDQGQLHPDDAVSAVRVLVSAGQTTTTNHIGNGMFILARDPALWMRLKTDPSLLPLFVEEVLRHSPSVLTVERKTKRAVTIDGVTIPEGGLVMVAIGAANRDPEKFPDPDRFDIERHRGAPNGQGLDHLAFGVGIHHCLGAPLLRMESPIAFAALLRRLESPRLADAFDVSASRTIDCGMPMHGFDRLLLETGR